MMTKLRLDLKLLSLSAISYDVVRSTIGLLSDNYTLFVIILALKVEHSIWLRNKA